MPEQREGSSSTESKVRKPGDILYATSGKYELKEKLGRRGAMGEVFEAVRVEAGEETTKRESVAVKFLRTDDPRDLESTRREAKQLREFAESETPLAVPTFLGASFSGNEKYIIMTKAPGRKVTEFLGSGELLVEEDVFIIGEQVAAILEFLHSKGKVYSDFKLDNIFFDRESKQVTVIDWNVVNQSEEEENRQKDLGRLARHLYRVSTGVSLESVRNTTKAKLEEIGGEGWQNLSLWAKDFFTRALHPNVRHFENARALYLDLDTLKEVWAISNNNPQRILEITKGNQEEARQKERDGKSGENKIKTAIYLADLVLHNPKITSDIRFDFKEELRESQRFYERNYDLEGVRRDLVGQAVITAKEKIARLVDIKSGEGLLAACRWQQVVEAAEILGEHWGQNEEWIFELADQLVKEPTIALITLKRHQNEHGDQSWFKLLRADAQINSNIQRVRAGELTGQEAVMAINQSSQQVKFVREHSPRYSDVIDQQIISEEELNKLEAQARKEIDEIKDLKTKIQELKEENARLKEENARLKRKN